MLMAQIDRTRGIRQFTARAPMYRLPVLQHLEGYYWKGAFSLVGGVVLHEYEGTPTK